MDIGKLGKNGQVTIPQTILKQAGIAEEAPLLIAAAPDGSIVLRQAGVYPIELYTDERIAEFERENAIPDELASRVRRVVRSRRKKPRWRRIFLDANVLFSAAHRMVHSNTL